MPDAPKAPDAPEAPLDPAATVALAADTLGVSLADPVDLGGSDRSVVLRCATPDGETVVVKQFMGTADGRDGWTRERTGLTVLDGAPDLLAADDAHRLLVMSDLGTGRTLADVLLDVDAAAARDAAVGWAGALGAMLATGRPRVAQAEALLASGTQPWEAMEAVRAGTARLLDLLGEAPSAALEADLQVLADLLAPDPAAAVVSPGDTCPDNALLTADGWRFLDLEGTAVHHVALDAAYALLPFPSCWCVFDPPADLTEAMLDALTQALAPAMPDVVGGRGWRRSVELACGAWILAANAWLVDGAVAARPSVGPADRPAPSFRALSAARWRWGAERLTALPAAARLLGRAAAWAEGEWGDDVAALPAYPAFAPGGI